MRETAETDVNQATFERMMNFFCNLKTADSGKSDDAEDEGVERSGGEVDDLLLGRDLGEAEPEGQNREGDAAEPGKDEEGVVDAVEGPGDLKLFGVRQQPLKQVSTSLIALL